MRTIRPPRPRRPDRPRTRRSRPRPASRLARGLRRPRPRRRSGRPRYTISLGYDGTGKRLRHTVRGKTKAEAKDKLDALHREISAGIQTPATYTVKQCVADSLELDPSTMATYRGQAEKWSTR